MFARHRGIIAAFVLLLVTPVTGSDSALQDRERRVELATLAELVPSDGATYAVARSVQADVSAVWQVLPDALAELGLSIAEENVTERTLSTRPQALGDSSAAPGDSGSPGFAATMRISVREVPGGCVVKVERELRDGRHGGLVADRSWDAALAGNGTMIHQVLARIRAELRR